MSPRLAGLVVLGYLGYIPEPEMITIPKGSGFLMGSPASERDRGEDEGPQREVTFAKSFAIGKYEVTFDEYDEYFFDEYVVFLKNIDRNVGCREGHRPKRPGDGGWGRERQPVINVSWREATCYAKWLTKKRGLDDKHQYRLPTEAEWEYAARAGTTTRYWWGDEVGEDNANCNGCGSSWDSKQTAPVDAFKPNPLDLYNTAGNVWEWVQDCGHENYEGAPSDGSRWGEEHGGDCARRVIRGGSWLDGPWLGRSATRYWSPPDVRYIGIGFRLAQDVD